MKVKKIIITAIALSVSMSALAFEIEGGQVLEHRTKITGNLQGAYLKDEPISRALRPQGDSTIDAQAYHAAGTARSNIRVEGFHSAYIVNNGTISKRYGYTVRLCADGDNCFEDFRNISLNPKGRFVDSSSSHSVKYFDKPGIFKTVAETIIIGDDRNSKRGENTIEVRKM